MKKIKLFTKTAASLLKSKTAINTYCIFAGNSLSTFFAFVFTVTIVRLLNLSDYGYFSALWSFLLLVSDIADIGIGSSLARFLPPLANSKYKLLSFLKSSFVVQIVIAFFVLLTVFIFSKMIALNLLHNSQQLILVRIFAIAIWGSIISTYFYYALSARQMFLQASIYTAVGGMLRILLLIPFIIVGNTTLITVIWSQTLSFLIWTITGIYLMQPQFLTVKRIAGDVTKLLSFGVFLGIARGLTALSSRLDILMLINLTNSVETGIYAIAARVISVYPVLAGSFTTVLAPKLASISEFKDLKKFMIKVIVATAGLILTIVVLIFASQPFLTILFTQKALPAVAVFRLLLLAMIFFVASIPPVSLAIYYLKKPQILTLNSIIQLIIVIAGNLYFIPLYGKNGAAYSLIAAYGMTLILTSVLSLYYLQKKHA